ncbi:MAG TPA: hypothetical protein DCR40_16125 [Prolixibacteraceae bacterium]|nr:hypothetical protein [Prolixibacteraceae bacterium]
MEPNTLIISPKTKVLQLIEAYPQLEEVLINYVPAFSKLRNPILRRTVAKIATLQQAAIIGNVKIEDLINLLRKEVGQDFVSISSETNYVTTQPGWFDANAVKHEIDIRKMLDAGEQPVNLVLADLNQLPAGEIYRVIAPFLPAPLIDKATSLNINHWINKEADDQYTICFMKK